MLRTRCDAIIAVVLVVILAAYGISLIIYYGSTEKPILQISEEHLHALIVDGNYSDALMVALSSARTIDQCQYKITNYTRMRWLILMLLLCLYSCSSRESLNMH